MFRLSTILPLSAMTFGVMLMACQVVNAQSEKIKEKPNQQKVKMVVEATAPVVLSKEQLDKTKNYANYLKELKQWRTEAIEVAKRLEKEGKLYPKPKKSDVYIGPGIRTSPISNWTRQMKLTPGQKIRFTKPVIEEMRACPEPAPKPVGIKPNLQLKLTNESDESVVINGDIYCDKFSIKVSITGPGAFRIPKTRFAQAMVYLVGTTIKLEPGKSHTIKLDRFAFGQRGCEGSWSFLKAGKHQITIEYSGTAGFQSPRITSKAETILDVRLADETEPKPSEKLDG